MQRVKRNLSICLTLAMVFSFLPGAAAFAQEAVPSCTGDTVSGTVVAVDTATGLVTIEQTDGTQCTVSMNSTYDQPIVGLLGTFFETVTPESLAAALDSLQANLDCTTTPCTLSGDGSGTPATVQSVTDNGDGTFTVVFVMDDGAGGTTTEVVIVDDPTLAQGWTDALNSLMANWNLTSDGSYSGAGDEIQTLHDDGMGFGVIVKFYAMAAQAQQTCADPSYTPSETDTVDPCSVTVQSLVDEFNSGTGMGQLFKEYGKPAYLGVGHVRNGTPDSHGKPDNPGKPENPGNSDKPCNPHANSHSPRSCSTGD